MEAYGQSIIFQTRDFSEGRRGIYKKKAKLSFSVINKQEVRAS